MKKKAHTPFALKAQKAMLRASARAHALSVATGTPFVVFENGRVVNLNVQSKRRTSQSAQS